MTKTVIGVVLIIIGLLITGLTHGTALVFFGVGIIAAGFLSAVLGWPAFKRFADSGQNQESEKLEERFAQRARGDGHDPNN